MDRVDLYLNFNYIYPFKPRLSSYISEVCSYAGNVHTLIGETSDGFIKVLFAANIPFHDQCYTWRDIVKNEMIITKHMSELGVSPMIRDMALSDTHGYMVMDKYEGNLGDLMVMYQYDKKIPMDKIMDNLRILVVKMHEAGITHNDLLLPNIMYKKDGSIAIIDYGNSTYNTSQILREHDMENLRAISVLHNRIKSGEVVGELDDMLDAVDHVPPNIIIHINGQECDHWGF